MHNQFFIRLHGISSYDAERIMGGHKHLKNGDANRFFIPADDLINHWDDSNIFINDLISPPSFFIDDTKLFKKFVTPDSHNDGLDNKSADSVMTQLQEIIMAQAKKPKTKSPTEGRTTKKENPNKLINKLGLSNSPIIEGENLKYLRNLAQNIFADVESAGKISGIVEKHTSRNKAAIDLLFSDKWTTDPTKIGEYYGYHLIKKCNFVQVDPAFSIFPQENKSDHYSERSIILGNISNDIHQSLYYWSILLDVSSLRSEFFNDTAFIHAAIKRICELTTTNMPHIFYMPTSAYAKLHFFLIECGKEPPESFAPLFFKPFATYGSEDPWQQALERIVKRTQEISKLRGDFFLRYLSTTTDLSIPNVHQGALEDVIGAVPSVITTYLP
ncbi:MAG: hypothetical protein HOM25_11800 [Rhodospirillaceae bacterium]|jgi:hypothetical protein|nr:hypothetical protein [Rhodospirillaceae bacterium]